MRWAEGENINNFGVVIYLPLSPVTGSHDVTKLRKSRQLLDTMHNSSVGLSELRVRKIVTVR